MISFSRYTLFHRFMRDRRGNFMILSGLGMAVIFLAAGLAIDYSLALDNKTRMSNALDAATLAAARSIAAGEISADADGDVKDYVKAVFAANLQVDDLDASPYSIGNVAVDSVAQTVSATASTDQPLHLIKVASKQQTMEVTSDSAVSYKIGDAEVAMVLDVTHSMGQWKMVSLKNSARLAVEILLSVNSAADEKVRVSVVPYAIGVNVGDDLVDYVYADYFNPTSNAPVYDVSAYNSVTNPVYYDLPAFRESIRESNSACEDSVPASTYYSRGVLNFVTGNSDNCWAYVANADGTNADNCASERKAPTPTTSGTSGTSYQFTDANPSYGMISRDARLGKDWCPETAIVPLTSDKDALDTAIDSFSAVGYTAGAIGLQWGWYTVSHDWEDYLPGGSKPGDHTDPDEKLKKFIIMMTDGKFNTAFADVSPSNYHLCCHSSEAYRHFSELCNAIKADDITIFTIGFELSDGLTKRALKNCATTGIPYYHDVKGAELEETFNYIAEVILTLRLTR